MKITKESVAALTVPDYIKADLLELFGQVSEKESEIEIEDGEEVLQRGRVTAKTCTHGVKKGWHCWQCGGLAKIGEE